MDIELKEITVGELTAGYEDNNEGGVSGYGGLLNIRPPYQREFIYGDKEREAVITTVENGYPLNVMYWAEKEDGSYEVMDGQQRTISLCQYVNGYFSHSFMFFHNLTDEEKRKILDYRLMIYVCRGTEREKLNWFKVINIAGMKLTDQELINSAYAGPFLSDAKRHFSKTGGPAQQMAADLLNGSPIRQEYLETAIKWHAASQGGGGSNMVEDYVAKHQHDANASQLWQYFSAVVTWVHTNFDVKRRKKVLKGIDLGWLYDRFHTQVLDREAIDGEIGRLIMDSEVQKKSGIVPYILTRDENRLGLRAFPDDIKMAAYERQGGNCPICGKHFDEADMEGDHITPWREGGKTVQENCQMLCKECNRRKGAR